MGGPEAARGRYGVKIRAHAPVGTLSRVARTLAGALALLVAAVLPASSPAQGTLMPADAASVPWVVGERLGYDVRFGFIKAGSGEMRIMGVEAIRGRPAWHGRFTVHGGYLALRVDDVLETWMDVTTLSSLRFEQDFKEIGRERRKSFEIFPERKAYLQRGKTEKPSVANPLDDGSFLYFIRTVPLVVGETYEFDRYFIPDRNPVTIRVLRRESISVPAGTFACIVIQPIIKTKGIFSENGQAEIWLTDDAKRIMVQMKSK
ncbi:MAG: DUF3108 domain-containing protein, partial [Gemmatimonadaceae bacterium]